ncbi:MAG: hypothetical protein ACHBN1_14390 [Heteroscytonema crispum UTEX LB 1556]
MSVILSPKRRSRLDASRYNALNPQVRAGEACSAIPLVMFLA